MGESSERDNTIDTLYELGPVPSPDNREYD